MNAKELKEAATVDTSLFPEEPGHVPTLCGYYFTPDQMQAFIDRICLEQRENCAEALKPKFDRKNVYLIHKIMIMNAKQPL